MEDHALYRPILKKAWQIAIKMKSLWFFGLFAAILGGGEFEILMRALGDPENKFGLMGETMRGLGQGLGQGASNGHFFANTGQTIMNQPLSFIMALVVMVVAILIILFFIWLSVVSQAGLIRNLDLANKNKKSAINEGVAFAQKNFWPVLGINALFKIIIFFILILVGWLLILWPFGLAGRLLYLILFIVAIAIILILSFIARYQTFFLLLKKQKFGPALKSAWKLFKNNWLISIEMAFILFVAYFIAAVITSIITLVLMAIPFILTFYLASPWWLIACSSVIILVLIAVIALMITAILSVFQWASWIMLFTRISGGDGVSRILRSAGTWPDIGKK